MKPELEAIKLNMNSTLLAGSPELQDQDALGPGMVREDEGLDW